MRKPKLYMPLGTSDDFENWIYDEHSAQVIEALMQTSAVERYGREEPMNSDTKTVPRNGGFTVAGIAKGGDYNLSTSDNDDVEIIARKVGGAIEINEEDLNDPVVDVLAAKRRAASRALAIVYDNACLGTSAAANGTTVPFESVYKALSTNGDANSIESGYTAGDHIVQITAANFVATMSGSGEGFDAINTWLSLYEDSDYFDDNDTVVFASPKFRSYLRGVKNADGNPMLVPFTNPLSQALDYSILGYQTVWTKGARKTATAKHEGFSATLDRPLLIIANQQLLIRGQAKLAPQIPASSPGFALQRAAQGIGFLKDKAYMKAAWRRGFKLGDKRGAVILEVTA